MSNTNAVLSLVSDGLKLLVMHGCGKVHCQMFVRTGDLTELMEMDWSHSPQASRQHYMTRALTWNLEGKKKRRRPRNCGVAIWKQTSRKLDATGDNWRDWLTTGMHGRIVLAPGDAKQALID